MDLYYWNRILELKMSSLSIIIQNKEIVLNCYKEDKSYLLGQIWFGNNWSH
jgi:hypothetical protein